MPEPGMGGKAEASVAGGFSTMGGGGGGRERALAADAARNAARNLARANEAQRMGGVSTFTDPGTGQLNQAQFNRVTGRTATNPYGREGFFSRMFGIDPANIDYSNITPGGGQGIATLNALALDRFNNPYAERNVLGNLTGAVPERGIARSGVKPGDYTSMGTARSYRQDLSPVGRGASLLGSFLGPLGSGYMIDRGTRVTGIEDNIPVSARTGEPLSPTRGGIMDILTGGQTDYIGEKTGTMVDSMMDFFTPNQQTTDIQSSDVSIPMSAYSEAGRPPSDIPQFSSAYAPNPSLLAQERPAARSYLSTPNRADMMAFEMANIAPSANSEVTVAPGEAVAPVSNLTMQDTYFRPAFSEQTLKDTALANIGSSQLEQSVLRGKIASNSQTGVMNELARRAALGDLTAQMAIDSLTPNY